MLVLVLRCWRRRLRRSVLMILGKRGRCPRQSKYQHQRNTLNRHVTSPHTYPSYGLAERRGHSGGARGSDAEWNDLCGRGGVRPVGPARDKRRRRHSGLAHGRLNDDSGVDDVRRAGHDARGRHRQLVAPVPRGKRCRLRRAWNVVTIAVCRGSCLMFSRTCPVADQRTDRGAGQRESQQQCDSIHGDYSFTGGRQPQEQLAPEQGPQSQRFDVFDMSTSLGG